MNIGSIVLETMYCPSAVFPEVFIPESLDCVQENTSFGKDIGNVISTVPPLLPVI